VTIVLTVAGFDPSGGAGILADVKAMSFLGCYGVAAVTCLTAQNTAGVFESYPQSRDIVSRQLFPLFEDFDIRAVKTGLLPTAGVVDALAEALLIYSPPHIVVDPVLGSSTGYRLADADAIAAMRRLIFPLATLVTPNASEAETLTGISVEDTDSMKKAAELLFRAGLKAVLVKGGDLEGEMVTDVLFDESGPLTISSKRVDSSSTHGTGCTMASAIASLLARGFSLRDSCAIAKQYVTEAIRTAPGVGRGAGPLNHFPARFDIPGVMRPA
jgi:hydroxymethylpyrimidine/phosphomethylpyrimidine kinase